MGMTLVPAYILISVFFCPDLSSISAAQICVGIGGLIACIVLMKSICQVKRIYSLCFCSFRWLAKYVYPRWTAVEMPIFRLLPN